MRPPEAERGAALLTVLLLVAVVAVLAGTALERLRIGTKLAANAGAAGQAQSYALAAETLATTRIDDLLSQSPDRVTLAGGWSGRPFGLPLPGGGSAGARVSDGGNCFNLNGLVRQTAPGVYESVAEQKVVFARLMRLLAIPGQVAEQVAGSAGDWIDTDQQQQANGAEDGVYTAQVPAYRTGGTLMADVSELRAVNGVTPDLYAKLKPYLCTLPVAEPARINVNTLLPEQAILVAMLYPDTLQPARAAQALLMRPPQGYENPAAFQNSRALGGLSIDTGGFVDVTSKWFNLSIDVTIGGTRLEEHALVDATHLPARLVSRQWGEQS